jgi:hypothetical protein
MKITQCVFCGVSGDKILLRTIMRSHFGMLSPLLLFIFWSYRSGTLQTISR